MLNIPENVKNTFLEESSHKILKFTTNPNWLYPEDVEYQKDMNTLNLFNGNAYLNSNWHMDYTSNPFTASGSFNFKIDRYSNTDSYDATKSVETFAFKYRDYVNVSMQIGINPTNQTYPSQMRFGVVYQDSTGAEREELVTVNVADYLVNSEWGLSGRVSVTIPTWKMSAVGAYSIKHIEWKSITGNVDFYGYIIYGRPIISVSDDPNDFPIQYVVNDYTTLDKTEYIPFVLFDNENIVFDKFSITESLCSKDNIEFGLCEAGHIEVDTVGTGNVKDETFYPVIGVADSLAEIPYSELKRINWYKGSIYNHSPETGFYSVWTNASGTNINTNRIGDVDIASYNQYFDGCSNIYLKCDVEVDSFNSDIMPAYISPAIDVARSNGNAYTIGGALFEISELINNPCSMIIKPNYETTNGTIDKITRIRFYFYDADENLINITCSTRIIFTNLQVGMLNNSTEDIPAFSLSTCYVYNNTLDSYLSEKELYYVPLGKYTVKDVSKKISHNLSINTLNLYDDMVLLEQNAANWYTHYMYGISTNEASDYGYEFARQIYSSYYNYMRTTGIVSEPTDMTQILTKTYSELESSMSTKTVSFLKLYYESTKELHNTGILYYAQVSIPNPNPQKLYSVKWFNYNYQSEVNVPWYYMHDSQKRGLEDANILVEELLTDGTYNKFLADPDDLFALSSNCSQLKIYVPMYAKYTSFSTKYTLLDHIEIYTTDKTFDLENASARLLYYDYNLNIGELEDPDETMTGTVINRCIPHIIFDCDSSITGRDVVHSILELTGCFFRMSRETGEPEFIYCTKSGLYPSNTLYPADDLYPRAGNNQVEGMGKYTSTECADYSVKKFGKIQILKNQSSNKAESNVQWQYYGDEDVGLNTYVIDDNIFYCNKDMTYDTEHMTDLNKTLQKMFYRISNMDYTPNVTKALGLPWLECGDRLGLLTYDGGFETFIYRRKLKGIQLLHDTYESHGDEYNNAIKNYGY